MCLIPRPVQSSVLPLWCDTPLPPPWQALTSLSNDEEMCSLGTPLPPTQNDMPLPLLALTTKLGATRRMPSFLALLSEVFGPGPSWCSLLSMCRLARLLMFSSRGSPLKRPPVKLPKRPPMIAATSRPTSLLGWCLTRSSRYLRSERVLTLVGLKARRTFTTWLTLLML